MYKCNFFYCHSNSDTTCYIKYVVYKVPNEAQVLRNYTLKYYVDCKSWQYFPELH